MKRLLATLGTATLAALLFATSCFAQAKDDTLVIGVAVFSDSISPAASGYLTLSLVYQTWEPLVARDTEDKLVPALAEKWEMISPTHWRFHLRKGVKWHDGTPVTATVVDVIKDLDRRLAALEAARRKLPAGKG